MILYCNTVQKNLNNYGTEDQIVNSTRSWSIGRVKKKLHEDNQIVCYIPLHVATKATLYNSS